ncbi:nucleotide sugar dehydrogenase [Deltaproteobacteria bacterium PRO3]|nr:nucleotide sugar dehydrogenase [Deltaproteobacteria bacterium PRO3]
MRVLRKNSLDVLMDKIQRRSARVGVIGLGYVGLPLAVAFAEAGFEVTGIDVDGGKVAALKAGRNYIPDIPDRLVRDLVRAGKLKATQDFGLARKLDCISICVPTPLRKTRDPDISYIVHATEELKKTLRAGQLIVLESTTYPGTTEELVLPQLQSAKFRAGKDFFLTFSPERIDPGNPRFGLKNTPKIIGGITAACTQAGAALYRNVADKVITVSSSQTAEMVKLLENTFRAVNIGLVNEIAQICDKLKINTWEVIDAAASKPFGFMPFYPGPGLGGHCIPVDPHYLSWKLRSMNYTTRFIELASEINQEMPHYVFQKIQSALNERRRALKGARILLLGVAYKKNVSDVRESPAYEVAKLLEEAGAKVSYSDPHVPQWKTEGAGYRSQPLSPAALKNCDCAVILTDHQDFDYRRIVAQAPLIVDTRNATKGLPQKKVVRL